MKKLFFRYGTMGSSKSLDLLRTAYNYENKRLNVLVLKSHVDTRDVGMVRSRIGLERKCETFYDDTNLYGYILKCSKEKRIDCVLVDEIQFAKKEHIRQLWRVVVDFDIPVICYGLRIDYTGNGFESSKELLTLAHEISELKTICKCGRKATHHLLRINGEVIFEGDGVMVGDKEFEEVCGRCWNRELNIYNLLKDR